jgi:hypothetical protein
LGPLSCRPPLPAAVVRRSFAQHATTTFFPHFVGVRQMRVEILNVSNTNSLYDQ